MVATSHAKCIFEKCPTCEVGLVKAYCSLSGNGAYPCDLRTVISVSSITFTTEVIAPHKDFPVMCEEIICNAFESCISLIIFKVMGSSLTLPLVITSESPDSLLPDSVRGIG